MQMRKAAADGEFPESSGCYVRNVTDQARAKEQDVTLIPLSLPAMPDSDDIRNARILIVDDCQDTAVLLSEFLTMSGYQHVSSTADAGAVCDLHAINNYDLMLLDMHMPMLSGLEVMAHLQRMCGDSCLPVVAITGDRRYKLAALEAGACDFITKPYDLREVEVRVRNMLEVRGMYSFMREQRRLQQDLALHDVLTGLPDRRLATDCIISAMQHAQRHEGMMAVLYIDLDGFTRINDQHGRACGDQLLQMVAVQLRNRMRQEDTVARIGGDEFLVVLSEISDASAATRSTLEILHALTAPIAIAGVSLDISASIGVAIYPGDAGDAGDAEDLIAHANQALYSTRRAGKSRYQFANRFAPLG
jgi:two-component system, cell cycle response regulator